MKKVIFVALILILLNNGVDGQCDNKLCTMKSNITSVKVLGATPGKVTIGKKAQIYIIVANKGTCAWQSEVVSLRVRLVHGPSGVSLNSSQKEDIAPYGDMKVYLTEAGRALAYTYEVNLNMKDRMPSGIYALSFTLVCMGKPFGEVITEEIEVEGVGKSTGVCKMESQILGSDVSLPSKIMANKKYNVDVNAHNLSSCVWDSPENKIELRVKCIAWPSGAQSADYRNMQPDGLLPLSSAVEVNPGGIANFEYSIISGNYPGTYTFEYQLYDKGKPFGVKGLKKVEIVGDPKRCDTEARIEVSSFPSEMVFNKEYSIVVYARNNGVCDWVAASRIELRCTVTQKAPGSPTKLSDLLPNEGIFPLGSKIIKPGEEFELRYKVKGPYMPGTYELTWSLFKDGHNEGIYADKTFKVVVPK
ncbi:MAG: hypothetical protein SGI83_14420 [Bacteroidota bacterium]|nr:hypothetical protein [Bacteroidota bacterium]